MDDTTKTREEPAAKPTFWAVLPAAVRYDSALPPNAKLLYAEISSLTDQRGYCYASNEYFMKLFSLSERTIQGLLKALRCGGYIRIADGDGGSGRRKIYAGLNPLSANPAENCGVTPQKFAPNPAEICTHNKKENKKEKQNTPIVPQGGRAAEEKKSSAPHWKPERFEAFWRYYPAIPDGNGRGRRPAKDRAVRAWDKLRPDDATIAAMGAALRRQKESRQWQEGVGIPYASTWLNARTWEEECEDLPAPAAAAAPSEEAIEWLN
jgi:hypothetical protein